MLTGWYVITHRKGEGELEKGGGGGVGLKISMPAGKNEYPEHCQSML